MTRLPPSNLHVSDIYLDYDSDSDTVRLTEEMMYGSLHNIMSVILHHLRHPIQRVLQYLPKCPHLSALFITYMRYKEDNDQLLSVIPHLTQLDIIEYFGAASVTPADTDVDEDILPVYDEADVRVVKAILKLTRLKCIALMWVDLGDDEIEVKGDITRLQEVRLYFVFMSRRSWDRFVSTLLTQQQAVNVKLYKTNINDATVRRILKSPHFTVTGDNREGDKQGRYKWLKFTTVPQEV